MNKSGVRGEARAERAQVVARPIEERDVLSEEGSEHLIPAAQSQFFTGARKHVDLKELADQADYTEANKQQDVQVGFTFLFFQVDFAEDLGKEKENQINLYSSQDLGAVRMMMITYLFHKPQE